MSIDAVFRKEVTRLARKALKQEMAPVRALIAGQRSQIAKLRSELIAMRGQLKSSTKARSSDAPSKTKTAKRAAAAGFSATIFKQQRARLEFTQVQFAQLLGVSTQSVIRYERNTTPQANTLQAFKAVSKLSRRAALKQIAAAE